MEACRKSKLWMVMMLATYDKLIIDFLVFLLFSAVLLGAMTFYHKFKGTVYQREAAVGDLSICAACIAAASVFATILPAMENMCLSSNQKTVIGVFRILPALIMAMSVLGLLFERNIHRTKVSLAIMIVAGLGLGLSFAVKDVSTCSAPEFSEAMELPSISWVEILGGFATAIMVAAAIITIAEWFRKRKRTVQQDKDEE